MKKLLFAMAIGAGLAWLFDPESGSRRRDALRKKFDNMRSTSAGTAGRPAQPIESRSDGYTTQAGAVPPTIASVP